MKKKTALYKLLATVFIDMNQFFFLLNRRLTSFNRFILCHKAIYMNHRQIQWTITSNIISVFN